MLSEILLVVAPDLLVVEVVVVQVVAASLQRLVKVGVEMEQ